MVHPQTIGVRVRRVISLLTIASAIIASGCSGESGPQSNATTASPPPPAPLSSISATVESPQPLYKSIDNVDTEKLALKSDISGEVEVVCETGDAAERFYGVAVARDLFTSLAESEKAMPMPGHDDQVIGYNLKSFFILSQPDVPLHDCPL